MAGITRRAFSNSLLCATAGLAVSAALPAHANNKPITDDDLAKGPIKLDLSKGVLCEVSASRELFDQINLVNGADSILLSEWHEQAQKAGWKPSDSSLLLTTDPAAFPDLSKDLLDKINSLGEGNILQVDGHSDSGNWQYYCLILVYGCESY